MNRIKSSCLWVGLFCAIPAFSQSSWTWRHPLPQGNTLNAVTWTGSKFAAVGDLGGIFVSADGIRWESRASGTVATLRSIIWTGSMAVAVGDSGVLLTSPDGEAWARRSSGTAHTLHSVAWNGNQFLAVGAKHVKIVSSNGMDWTVVTPGSSVSPLNVADSWLTSWLGPDGATWTDSQWVVADGYNVQLSPDGFQWTTITPPQLGSHCTHWCQSYKLETVKWTGNLLVASGSIYNSQSGLIFQFILTSSDGVNWTPRAPPRALTTHTIVRANGQLMAFGGGYTLFSTDGIDWQARTSNSVHSTSAIWTGNRFLTVGEGGSVAVSADGSEWNKTCGIGNEHLFTSATWTGNQYVAVGTHPENGVLSGSVFTSNDGIDWIPRSSSPPGRLQSVIWGRGRLLTVSLQGQIFTSPDGDAWTRVHSDTTRNPFGTYPSYISAVWTGNLFVVVGSLGIIVTSPDGVNWTPGNSGTSRGLLSVAWNGSQLTAVGDWGAILTSSDGINWAWQNSGTSNRLQSVTWAGSTLGWVAVGDSGSILFSQDGGSWTFRDAGTRLGLNTVLWTGNQLMVSGWNYHGGGFWNGGLEGEGVMLSSRDGTNWKTWRSPAANPLPALAWNGSRFVAAGRSGNILTSEDDFPLPISSRPMRPRKLSLRFTPDRVFARLPSTWKNGGRLSLLTLLGRELIQVRSRGPEDVLPLHGVPAGIYLLRASGGGEILSQKIRIGR